MNQLLITIIIIIIIIILIITTYFILNNKKKKGSSFFLRYDCFNDNPDLFDKYLECYKHIDNLNENECNFMNDIKFQEDNLFNLMLEKINEELNCISPDQNKNLYVMGDVHGSVLSVLAPLVQANLLQHIENSTDYIQFDYTSNRFIYNPILNQSCNNIVVYTGDIVERAYHRHSLALFIMVLQLAKNNDNIKYLIGNHDLITILDWNIGLQTFEIIEERSYDKENENIKKDVILEFINYVKQTDELFYYYNQEYKVLASHTIQYYPKFESYINYQSGQPYSIVRDENKYKLCSSMLSMRYIELYKNMYDKQEINNYFENSGKSKDKYEKYINDMEELYNIINSGNNFTYENLNKILKKCCLLCCNLNRFKYIDLSLKHFQNPNLKNTHNYANAYNYNIFDIMLCILLTVVWTRPPPANTIEYTNNILKIENIDYDYHIIGHTTHEGHKLSLTKHENESSIKYIFNDYSDLNVYGNLNSRITRFDEKRYKVIDIVADFPNIYSEYRNNVIDIVEKYKDKI